MVKKAAAAVVCCCCCCRSSYARGSPYSRIPSSKKGYRHAYSSSGSASVKSRGRARASNPSITISSKLMLLFQSRAQPASSFTYTA